MASLKSGICPKNNFDGIPDFYTNRTFFTEMRH